MGLLDEAIRQHLELKRQHGASDEELQIQEQEALGPVRREPAEPTATSSEDIDELPQEPALDQDVEEAYDEAPMEPQAEAPAYEEALAEAAEDAPLEPPYEEFEEPVDPLAEPAPAEGDAETELLAPEEGFEPEPSGDTPSRGFDAVPEPLPEDAVPEGEAEAGEEELLQLEGEDGEEDVLEVEGEEGDEDVLEETPEFLQETPEHDRLWFEQRPPRDFDFDE